MKVRFAIIRQDLVTALDKTSRALSAAPTESILKNFLIEATSDGIWVSASDKVVTASTFVKTPVSQQGKLLFPSAKGSELVKKSNGTTLAMGLTDDDSISILSGKSRWNLRTRSADSYPETGVAGYESEVHEVGVYELFSAIQSVHKAMALNLTGFAQISVRQGRVRAADGVWFQEAPILSDKDLDFAIPRAVVSDVLAFLSYDRSILKISLTEDGLVIFQDNKDILSFRLPSQKAPDLSKAFAVPLMTNKDALTVSRSDLRAAIGRVAIAADSDTQAISFALSAATIDSVVVSAKSRDGSWADEPVSCSWVGDTRKVFLHKDYILNALGAFTSSQVTFKLGPDNPSSPSQVLIQGQGRSSVLNQLRSDLL